MCRRVATPGDAPAGSEGSDEGHTRRGRRHENARAACVVTADGAVSVPRLSRMVLFELSTAEAACFLILTHPNVPKEGIRRLFLGRFSSGDGRGLADDSRHGDRRGALTPSHCALLARPPPRGLACCGVSSGGGQHVASPPRRVTAPRADRTAGSAVAVGARHCRGHRGAWWASWRKGRGRDRQRDGHAGTDMRTDRRGRRHRAGAPGSTLRVP